MMEVLAYIAAGIGVIVGWIVVLGCYAQFRNPRRPRRR